MSSQETKNLEVNYAAIKIAVPENYIAKSEFEIRNDLFSAQWMYLSSEMFYSNIQDQILAQMVSQLPLTEIGTVTFKSKGEGFTGKKYKLNDNWYVIYASGIVNKQPLILNLGFRKEPKSNDDLDGLMKNFILF